jgi:hypothetical protein
MPPCQNAGLLFPKLVRRRNNTLFGPSLPSEWLGIIEASIHSATTSCLFLQFRCVHVKSRRVGGDSTASRLHPLVIQLVESVKNHPGQHPLPVPNLVCTAPKPGHGIDCACWPRQEQTPLGEGLAQDSKRKLLTLFFTHNLTESPLSIFINRRPAHWTSDFPDTLSPVLVLPACLLGQLNFESSLVAR